MQVEKSTDISSNFVLGEKGDFRIKEMEGRSSLHESLSILGLENMVDVRDVLQADLMNKEHLH